MSAHHQPSVVGVGAKASGSGGQKSRLPYRMKMRMNVMGAHEPTRIHSGRPSNQPLYDPLLS